jgi:hypothetical protein
MILSYHNILSKDECRVIRSTIWDLREEWTERNNRHPPDFFTLGVATYLDVLDSNDAETLYYARIGAQNTIIQHYFGSLLLRIHGVLGEIIGESIEYTDDLALPGFHIFLGDAIARAGTAPAHFDMQYEALRWDTKARRFIAPFVHITYFLAARWRRSHDLATRLR